MGQYVSTCKYFEASLGSIVSDLYSTIEVFTIFQNGVPRSNLSWVETAHLMAETDENPWPSGLFAEYTHFDFFDHPNIQKQAVQNPL